MGDSDSGSFSPVEYNGVVYGASAQGKVFAVNKETGAVKWSIKLDGPLKAGIAVATDTLAVIDDKNRLLGLDLQGNQKWKTELNGDVTSIPVGAPGSILVRTIDFSVANYSTENGGLRWKHQRQLPPLTLRLNTPVEVNNARVYAGFPGGKLVGLDLNNGNVVWEGVLASASGTTEIERISDITGTPTYNYREICAASFQGRAGCLDASTGRAIWAKDFSSPNGASVDDRYLIAANESGDLFAFSRNGGDQVWRVETLQRRKPTNAVVIGRAVAIGDFEGYVHFINRDSGITLARLRVGSKEFTGTPVPVETDGLLVQSRSGTLAYLSIR